MPVPRDWWRNYDNMNPGSGVDIALCIPAATGGGAEKVMIDLASSFGLAGYRVDLVLMSGDKGDLDESIPDLHVICLAGHRTLGALPRLVRYIRKTRPKVLMSTMTYMNIVAIIAAKLACARTRLVVREATRLSIHVEIRENRKNRFLPVLTRLTYPFADSCIAVSEDVASDISAISRLPPEKVQVINNPLEIEHVRSLADDSIDWGLTGAPGVPLIVSVGRLSNQKDYITLVRSIAELHSSACKASLVIVGDGEVRSEIIRETEKTGMTGYVRLIGFRKNPCPYIRAADVFALSSAVEGMPNVLLEARALGTPIVATDAGSGVRQVLGDGKYGLLVPPGNPAALAAALHAVLEGEYEPVDGDKDLAQYDPAEVSKKYLRVMFDDAEIAGARQGKTV